MNIPRTPAEAIAQIARRLNSIEEIEKRRFNALLDVLEKYNLEPKALAQGASLVSPDIRAEYKKSEFKQRVKSLLNMRKTTLEAGNLAAYAKLNTAYQKLGQEAKKNSWMDIIIEVTNEFNAECQKD